MLGQLLQCHDKKTLCNPVTYISSANRISGRLAGRLIQNELKEQ